MTTTEISHARDLISLEGLSAEEISSILEEARRLRDHIRGDELASRVVANLFFENSTRTRCSFEVAAARLGAHPLNLTSVGSSAAKGESLVDTALQLEAMGVDAIVVRTGINGGPMMVAEACDTPVINAGDGRHEHPTQALLDLFVMCEHFGSLAGRQIAIVGDILNSRVARSNVHGLGALGADVILVGPPTMLDESFESVGRPGGVRIAHDLDEVLEAVDVVMMLRIQRERGSDAGIASDYRRLYGMTAERAKRLREEQLLMHPGPINHGVEIDSSVLTSCSSSVILQQVAAGVFVRAATLMRAIRP